MDSIADTIHVNVEYFTGFEDGEDDVGYAYYVASCQEIVAVTEGRTWSELMHNIHEMIAAHLEGEDSVKLYNLDPNARIIVTMELPENYAEIA
ncbi:MAG: type II toxin-antitoxin system HicB family antitoxin [Anaerolineae bacterium]|nr:type II toxin-antitoxin system HicB family antitoxin [Anaerolineae bacterium]